MTTNQSYFDEEHIYLSDLIHSIDEDSKQSLTPSQSHA